MSNRGNVHPDERLERIADDHKRAASERDTSRAREPQPLAALLGSAEVIAAWTCRNVNCPDGRPLVPVNQATIDNFAEANIALMSRGERRLGTDEIMLCNACAKRLRAVHDEQAERRREKTRALITELRKGAHYEREREIIEQLKKWQPASEVDALVRSISERRTSGRKGAL